MKNGKCPKCKASEIYSGANIKMKGGTYCCNSIPLGGLFGGLIVLDNYVCTSCGYLESYINDQAELEKVRNRWEKVQ